MKVSDFQRLNIIFVEYDKAWSLCPYHKDILRPNLSISLLDRYYGRYKCWACGRAGCLTKEQTDKLSLSDSIPYKNDRHKFSIMWKVYNKSCYDNLQKYPLLKLGLAKQLNISIASLDDWLVGYDGDAFTISMYREDLGEYKREDGICGIQRRFPDGTKRCVSGSRLGLMYPRILIGDYYLFICEGFSDAIAIWDLGLQSIARPHCRYVEGIGDFLGYSLGCIDNIIIIPDNDTVGLNGARQLRDELDEVVVCQDESGYDIDCEISIFSFDGVKDIREYISVRGKQQVRQELGNYI